MQAIISYEQPEYASISSSLEPAFKVVRLQDFEPPFTLAPDDRRAYLRRVATLFVDDVGIREGSTGRVFNATNAFGEHFALKVYDRDSNSEYAIHRKVSGVKGYPNLYGRALLAGKPVLVMEWIEGEDLSRFAARMAIDDAGRLSPLMVARIGRDLFDVLSRTSVLEGDLVHGDLSFRNIMISTSFQSVEEQVQQGSFDLRLIDLGSARMTSGDQARVQGSVAIAATPQFAAPELQSGEEDGRVGASSVVSPAADVYAAARILSCLLYGDDLSAFSTVHCSESDIAAVLMREPEVAVAVDRMASSLTPAPSKDEIAAALKVLDEPLFDLLQCAMDPDPAKRPTATEMRDAFASYCSSYVSNLGRALRGEELDPCNAPFIYKGLDRLSLKVRNVVRIVGKSVSFSLLALVAVVSASLVLSGDVSVAWQGVKLDGSASGALVLSFFLPVLLGYVLCGKKKYGSVRLVRATLGVVIGGAIAIGLSCTGEFSPTAFKRFMCSAAIAATFMAWCPLVLDRVFPPVSARVERRYRRLPSRVEGDNEEMLSEEGSNRD